MEDEWKAFLVGNGARVVDDIVLDFGNIAEERRAGLESAAIVDLSDYYAVIRAAGSDALSFLNGQLTNDLRSLDDRHHLLAAYCNPKGRAIALLRIWRDGDDWLLLLPASLAQAVCERLRQYILRAKVTLGVDTTLATFGVVGPKADTILQNAEGINVPSVGELIRTVESTILGIDGVVSRFLIVAPVAARQTRWLAYRRRAVASGLRLWRWHDVQAGQPTVLPPTSEAFVPQMLNLDRLGGIHFNKGCYPGQEIVARMHYLGKLKQRLYRLFLPGDAPPVPGTEIYAERFGEQSAGTVVDAVTMEDGRIDLLAVVQIANAESDTLHLASPHGPKLLRDDISTSNTD